jgi:hypothetical protein
MPVPEILACTVSFFPFLSFYRVFWYCTFIVLVHFDAIKQRWEKEYPDGPSSIRSRKLLQELGRGWLGIMQELVRRGVFVEMRDGRINMPDLFRVGFKLGRKGGVLPSGMI